MLHDAGIGRWTRTKGLRQHQRLAAALHFVVKNILHIRHAMAVRIANGPRRLAKFGGAHGYFDCS